jgi:hypothetical protein
MGTDLSVAVTLRLLLGAEETARSRIRFPEPKSLWVALCFEDSYPGGCRRSFAVVVASGILLRLVSCIFFGFLDPLVLSLLGLKRFWTRAFKSTGGVRCFDLHYEVLWGRAVFG